MKANEMTHDEQQARVDMFVKEFNSLCKKYEMTMDIATFDGGDSIDWTVYIESGGIEVASNDTYSNIFTKGLIKDGYGNYEG